MFLISCFEFLNTLKLYHWKTRSFARHKASDECGTKLAVLLDRFVEAYLGRYGHQSIAAHGAYPLRLRVLNDKQMTHAVWKFRASLGALKLEADSELANIRDEMVAEVDQCLYLFELD
jgi:hypothetical protein